MQATIKYISSISGKTVIVSVDGSLYVFNIFEGFQRYCIYKGVSLKQIKAIFIPSIECIPPLCGLCLTLRDMGVKSLNVVCCKKIQNMIVQAQSFCSFNKLKLVFNDQVYEDTFVRVTESYLLHIKDIRGKFLVEKVPAVIPKSYYKELALKKEIVLHGVSYYGKDYVNEDISFNDIFINYGKILPSVSENSLILCFDIANYKYYAANEYNAYYLECNEQVDYEAQYLLASVLNNICNDFLIPGPYHNNCFFRIRKYVMLHKRLRTKKTLQDEDTFVYNSSNNVFQLKKKIKKKYVSCRNEHKKNSVTFLGTGCAIPSKFRNVSGIIVNIENLTFLLDCGEDTVGQLKRIYGTYKVLDYIDFIYVSHSHGDHSLGLFNILQKMTRPIKIVGPSVILNFAMLYAPNIICFPTDRAKLLEKSAKILNIKDDILNYELEICGCTHSNDSCSVAVKYKNMKISYSGDTTPSQLFARISQNSDVMIHESTFCNENRSKAEYTKHSTLDEAQSIFLSSKSKVLILTHFSQRYPKHFVCSSLGIPAFDFYRYMINTSTYPGEAIEKHLSEY